MGRALRGRGKMGYGGQGCPMGSCQNGSWDVGLPTCSATPAPFPGGPEATRKERGRSRGQLGFGNQAAIIRPQEPTPGRPSLNVYVDGSGPSVRDCPTWVRAVVVRSLPMARSLHAAPASCRGVVSLADAVSTSQARDKGFATSTGVLVYWKKERNQKNRELTSNHQSVCRSRPWPLKAASGRHCGGRKRIVVVVVATANQTSSVSNKALAIACCDNC